MYRKLYILKIVKYSRIKFPIFLINFSFSFKIFGNKVDNTELVFRIWRI